MKEGLKLFVWEDVLCDYGCGIILAVAEDIEEARKIIKTYSSSLNKHEYEAVLSDIKKEPREITDKEALFVWGGG